MARTLADDVLALTDGLASLRVNGVGDIYSGPTLLGPAEVQRLLAEFVDDARDIAVRRQLGWP